MDAQDQNRTSPTGHKGHGVHLCGKCGWPFPKPHPSAKHRRAHRKVCGKVEGYLMNISHSGRASDDSEEDMQTPSPKLDKENMKEPGSSGGSGSDLLRSCKSEDELFSDAVTEFSESGYSPSPQESMDRVKQLLGDNVGKELENDLVDDVQQLKDEEHNDLKKAFDDSIRESEEAVGNTTSDSESIPAKDIRVQEISVGVDQVDGVAITYPNIATENGNSDKAKELTSSEPDPKVEGKRSVTELDCSMGDVDSLDNASENGNSDDKAKDEVSVGVDQIDGEPITYPDIASENGNSDKAKDLTSSELDMNVEGKRSVAELESFMGNVDSPDIASENGNSDDKAKEEVSVGVDQIDGEPITYPDIAPENVNSDKAKDLTSSEPDTNVEGKRSVAELECSVGIVDSLSDLASELETRPDELKNQGYEHVGSDNVTPVLDRKTSDTVNLEPKLQETEIHTVHSSATDEATGQEKELSLISETGTVIIGHVLGKIDDTEQEQTSTLQVDKTEHDLSSQICPPKDADLSSSKQVEADSTEEHVKLAEDNELEVEESKKVLPVPVSESLQVIEKPNIMIEDYIDGEVLKPSFPLDLGNGEVTRPVEIDEKVVTEPGPSNISSLTISQPDLSTSIDLQKDALESVVEEIDATTSQVISEEGSRTHGTETYHNTLNHFPEVNLEATQGLEVGSKSSNNELGSTDALGVYHEDLTVASDKQLENSKDSEAQRSINSIGDVSEMNLLDQDEVTKKDSKDSVYEEPTAPVISEKIPAGEEDLHNEDPAESELLINKAENKLTVENLCVPVVDGSAISCSRTKSLEGNWGSVSVLSTQSDGTTHTDAEALEKSEGSLLKPQTTSDAYRPDKSDVYEPPSFLTLVNSRPENEKTVEASEITEPSKSEAVDAGWIPSLTNVVNDSEGRKKNEEIIAKVTNWSPGKQHSPLKNLLNEAHAETKVETSEKQLAPKDIADEAASKNKGSGVATVSSIMGSETPVHDEAKREMEKEWNSPARYPTVIKKEKKKGKPYWVPFVCCTSAQRDM